MTIFGDLFFGNIKPHIEGDTGNDSQYSEISNKVEIESQYFSKMLSEEDSERFDEMWDTYNKLGVIEVREGFICGFKLAVKIMNEVYN